MTLTAKMMEALDYVASYGTAGTYSDRTLTALVNRGLIQHTDRTDAVRAGAAWGYRVTDAGQAALPASHSTVASTTPREQYADTPARCSPEVTAEDILSIIDNPPTAQELNERRNWEVTMSEPTALLYDSTASQAMVVLGANAVTLFYRYENDAADLVRSVPFTQLQRSDKYSAVCRHIHGAGDSCPNCDRDAEELSATARTYGIQVSDYRGQGLHAELGWLYCSADSSWVAVAPDGSVIGTSIATERSAKRALVLDHKMRSWSEALRVAEKLTQPRHTLECATSSDNALCFRIPGPSGDTRMPCVVRRDGTPGFVSHLVHADTAELYRVVRGSGTSGVILERIDSDGTHMVSGWTHRELREHFTATCSDGYPLGRGCPLHDGGEVPFKVMTLAEYLGQVSQAMQVARSALLDVRT